MNRKTDAKFNWQYVTNTFVHMIHDGMDVTLPFRIKFRCVEAVLERNSEKRNYFVRYETILMYPLLLSEYPQKQKVSQRDKLKGQAASRDMPQTEG